MNVAINEQGRGRFMQQHRVKRAMVKQLWNNTNVKRYKDWKTTRWNARDNCSRIAQYFISGCVEVKVWSSLWVERFYPLDPWWHCGERTSSNSVLPPALTMHNLSQQTSTTFVVTENRNKPFLSQYFIEITANYLICRTNLWSLL